MTDTFTLSADAASELGMGELVDACDAIGIEVGQVSKLVGNARLRFLVAVAWVILRRDDPELTFLQASRVKLEVAKPAPAHPTQLPRSGRTAARRSA